MNKKFSLSLLTFTFLSFGFILVMSSCSTSRTIKSIKASQPIEINANLSDWPRESTSRSASEDFDVSVANDDEFVYVAIQFKNNRTQLMARDYGFRVFFDQDDSFRRSFGIVYPIGMAESLADFPGARKSYLENPGWRNMVENRGLVESVENTMHERVQIISRRDRRAPVRPVTVNKDQLRANSIELAMNYDTRRMLIEMKIPIRPSRDREFSVDENGQGYFTLGFEIVPPDYEEVTGETPTYETVDNTRQSRQGGYDQYGTGRQQRTELQVSNPQLYAQLNYNYQNWIRVRLDK
jgi:hypothetical protein